MSAKIVTCDERLGVPSASKLMRLKLCPGSYWMEYNNLTFDQRKSTPDAERGTRIHKAAKALAMDEKEAKFDADITGEEIEEARKLFNIYKRIQSEVFQEVGGFSQQIVEERFWMSYGEWNPIFTGQIDIGEIRYNTDEKVWEALICDYKTGWAEIPPAEINLQMRGYAVLLKVNHTELKRITVAVISPNTGKPTIARYEENDLELAREEVIGILLSPLESGEDLCIPGVEQCKYCPAKTKCPEYREAFVAVVPRTQDFALTAQEWTPEQRTKFCERLPEITRWLEDRKAEVKALAKAGGVPDWGIGEGKKVQKIKDPQEAYRRLAHLLSADSFAKSCTVSLPKLRKEYARARKATETEAKYHLTERLGDIIEETQTEGQLEKIK